MQERYQPSAISYQPKGPFDIRRPTSALRRRTAVWILFPALAIAAGCAEQRQAINDQAEYDEWLTATLPDRSVREGVIAQRTLYDYHFVRDGADLNDLGRRDVAILGEHFRGKSGEISVRRGGAPDLLYWARTEQVRTALAESGLAPEGIRISDAMSGGRGLTADEVLIVYEAAKQPSTPQPMSGMGTTIQTGVQR